LLLEGIACWLFELYERSQRAEEHAETREI
jgi:hypothetical protein